VPRIDRGADRLRAFEDGVLGAAENLILKTFVVFILQQLLTT
jgi:hypothetical protein